MRYLPKLLACVVAAFAFVTTVAGCASIRPSDAGHPTILTMDRILRLAASEGHSGVDAVVGAFQAHYGVSAHVSLSPLINAKAPMTLVDGMRVVQVLTDINSTGDVAREIRIDVANRPCLSIDDAAAWIGAKRMFATAGDDKVTGHVDYLFENAAVRIDLIGDFPGPECLRVVTIYKQP